MFVCVVVSHIHHDVNEVYLPRLCESILLFNQVNKNSDLNNNVHSCRPDAKRMNQLKVFCIILLVAWRVNLVVAFGFLPQNFGRW